MTKDISDFQKRVGVSFADDTILLQAFTHRSYLNEHTDLKTGHNERLEFLGDAVLELVVTRFLFDRFPDKPEGELTSYRSALVNTKSIAEAATAYEMDDYLRLSKGERRDTGRAREHILANTFEAVIGAIYLDLGYEAAKQFIETSLFHKIDGIIEQGLHKDAKSFVQEKAQEVHGITPSYELVKEEGPDHDKHFVMGIYFGDDLVALGEGKSKQDAQQAAAAKAVEINQW